MKKKQKLLFVLLLFAVCMAGMIAGKDGSVTQAAIVKKDVTPIEPANSDLVVEHTVTKLASKRWIQSFTKDSKYYYYIQVTKAYKGHLRITRVKYTGLGRYLRDSMNLKNFGHATNLDCSVYNGVTYLWTGSNSKNNSEVSRSISGFRYQKNKTLRRKGTYNYNIPMGTTGKYVTNVYPAINQNSTQMAVRFTYRNNQYYQVYNLVNGTKINVRSLVRQVKLGKTSGDFQGFDIAGSTIYTIEGSPRKSFLKTFDKKRKYQPTIIRSYNFNTGGVSGRQIRGAQQLSFREPEGIKILQDGTMQIMYVSNTLTDMSCNIYNVK